MLLRHCALLCVLAGPVCAQTASPVPSDKPIAYPAWWFSSDVIPRLDTTNQSPSYALAGTYKAVDDFGALNQGQLKHMAQKAYEQMKSLGLIDPVEDPDHELVELWESPVYEGDNLSAINLGQLKNIARPFYQRLFDVCYLEGLPDWLLHPAPGVDHQALANIGQLKQIFSFSFLDIDAILASQLRDEQIGGVSAADWVAWYRSDLISGSLGAPLGIWADQIGDADLAVYPGGATNGPALSATEGGGRAVLINATAAAGYLRTDDPVFDARISDAFTVLILFKPLVGSGESTRFIISDEQGSFLMENDSGADDAMMAHVTGHDAVSVDLNGFPDGVVTPNKWQYFALTCNAASGIELYKNGRLVAKLAAPSGQPSFRFDGLKIGAASKAQIADLAVLATRLSAAQVADYGEKLNRRARGLLNEGLAAIKTPGAAHPVYVPDGTQSSLNGQTLNLSILSPAAGSVY